MQATTVSNPLKTVSSSSLLCCAKCDYMWSTQGGQDDFGEDYCAGVGEKNFLLVDARDWLPFKPLVLVLLSVPL